MDQRSYMPPALPFKYPDRCIKCHAPCSVCQTTSQKFDIFYFYLAFPPDLPLKLFCLPNSIFPFLDVYNRNVALRVVLFPFRVP